MNFLKLFVLTASLAFAQISSDQAAQAVSFSATTGVNKLVGSPSVSGADPFAASTVIQLNVNSAVSLANMYNQAVIKNYNLDVANFASSGGVNPIPVAPLLKVVDPSKIITALSAFPFRIAEADYTTYQRYTPPAPAAPAQSAPAALTSVVGADLGGGYYGCVPGDPTPDGRKVSDPRGVFLKHLTPSAVGSSCWFTAVALVD